MIDITKQKCWYCLLNAGVIAILIVIAVTTFSWLAGVIMLSNTGPGEFLRFAVSTPGAAGSVLGILAGFVGVIVTTGLGFYFSIRAREHQADLDRERDAKLRDQEARALAASLTGEIEVIAESVGILAQQAERVLYGENLRPEDIWSPRVVIFEANADRIGLLGIDTARDISHIIGVTYALADGVRGRLRGFDPDMVAETAGQTTAIEKSARQLAENLRQKALPHNTPPAPPAEDQPDHPAAPEDGGEPAEG